MKRRILFVDDEPLVLEGLRRILHGQRAEWEMRFAAGGAQALALLEEFPADVVLTDMRMPGMDGARLLEQVALRWPETVRILFSGQTDTHDTARAVPVAHQFLAKPCDPVAMRQALQRAWSLRDVLQHPDLRRVVGGIDVLPSVPQTYLELGRTLADPNGSVEEIAAIVERDPALTAKMLQLVNSSFFGQRREVSSVASAAALLGTGLIRTLTLSHSLFVPGVWGAAESLSLEAEQAHGLAVGALARRMLPERELGEAAAAAGILHDLGKLILASRLPAVYRENLSWSRAEGRPLHAVERERLGVTHAEVGAYLLALWDLPHRVVEAVAHHHAPSVSAEAAPVLAAVHVADALVHRITEGDAALMLRLDRELVERAGWNSMLATWSEWAAQSLEGM